LPTPHPLLDLPLSRRARASGEIVMPRLVATARALCGCEQRAMAQAQLERDIEHKRSAARVLRSQQEAEAA
jgi:hypothetical protein